MTRTAILLGTLATALATGLTALPAEAQTRVFVSGSGSDSNPCTFASPCRSFQQAFNTVTAVTTSGGEIDVLDPAGYGPLTVNHGISIQGHEFSGITAASTTPAITINAGASDKINLRGLLIDGGNAAYTGIQFNSGGALSIQDCVVRNFTSYTIAFFPNSASQLYIVDSVVSDSNLNDGNTVGIFVSPNDNASASAYLDNVEVLNNGIGVAGQGSGVYIAIRHSYINGNNFMGLEATSDAIIHLSQSMVTGNATGWSTASGGAIASTGDNFIDDNPMGNGAPPGLAYK